MAAEDWCEKQVSTKITPELFAALEEEKRKALELIKEELCPWLSQILQEEITQETFWSKLDTGVLVCKLANFIQKASNGGKGKTILSKSVIRFNEHAAPESFPARDNASEFIKWCRSNEMGDAVLFESEGLVLHKDEKRVILCLLEVARLAGRVGLPTPEIVQMEKEIDTHMKANAASNDSVGARNSGSVAKKGAETTLEEKVTSALKDCKCELKARKCDGGAYIISGGRIRGERKLYARLLRDRVMVRVGGGWDTLDHFLLEHDPCRIVKFSKGELQHHAMTTTVTVMET